MIRNIKKSIVWIVVAVITGCMLSGCNTGVVNNNDKLQVVCTIFPIYDWTREILGDNIENVDLTLLLDNGADLHNYQPSVEDIVKISSCDVFIYVGGTSDAWVSKVLAEATNDDMCVISLLEILGTDVKEEEIVDGMEEEEHDHDHEEEEHDDAGETGNHDHEEEVEFDEHVWLSVKNAIKCCNAITDTLSAVDGNNGVYFRENADAYTEKLEELDAEYEQAITDAEYNTLIFADRFPFRYLADDYGLSYYAAFVGCSAETEASFETIKFLAQKADELKVPVILVIETSNQELAKTVIANTVDTDRPILVMDSMQSITEDELNNTVTYLSVMQSNLITLKEAIE